MPNNRFRFRAWDAKQKKMFDVHDMKFSEVTSGLTSVFGYNEEPDDKGGWKTRYGGNITKDCQYGKRYFVMQCSGILASKSYRGETQEDKLIYEGDLIFDSDLEFYGEVKFREDTMAWMVCDPESNGDEREFLQEFIDSKTGIANTAEIVGNVFENEFVKNNHLVMKWRKLWQVIS